MAQQVQQLLAVADIEIDGKRPWDIQVHNPALYDRILAGGSLAVGESYMDGWWDVKQLDGFFAKVFQAQLEKKVNKSLLFLPFLKASMLNLQKKSKAFKIGKSHYDKGNDLYKAMLDKRMTYTCGYWKHAKTLDAAQKAKLDLVCKKLGLKKGQRVLDIGCGWGSFCKYAAEKYKVEAVGITVSEEQATLAREMCKGLPVDIRLQDYRDVDEKFDHIISLGMFEHVGYKNYRKYMEVAHRCLKDGGLFLLHTIGCNISVKITDPWIDKYIFPDSMLPSMKQVSEAVEGIFVIEDFHNFGADYDKTLMAWYANFDKHWDKLKDTYDERFYRMWKFYLLSCAGGFRARKNQLWQILLSKQGAPNGYKSIR